MKINKTLPLLLLLFTFLTTKGQEDPTTFSTGCWKQIAIGSGHSIAIKNDGTLWAWGGGNYGQLGNGTYNGNSNMAIQISSNNWKQVSTSDFTSYAIRLDGTLWAWGYNVGGQYGNGTTTASYVPLQIGTATNWKEISANNFGTLAIKTDGTLWGWGATGGWGTTGNGTSAGSQIPIQIGTSNNWKQVSAGLYHSAALQNDGTMWAWGNNGNWQFGNGTNTWSYVPLQIGIGSTWKHVSAGQNLTMAIKTDGSLWVAGSNLFGQFGNGTNDGTSSVFIRIGLANNWKSVNNSFSETLALKINGTLWAWGNNWSGQLGIGTDISTYTPTQIGTSSLWEQASSGGYNSGGIRSDGTLWMWGTNSGAFGNGTTVNSYTPVNIGCPTSLNNNEVAKRTITIYPNPFKDEITIEGLESESNYVLYNSVGQVIQFGTTAPDGAINLSAIAKGLYYLRIENTTLKMIKA